MKAPVLVAFATRYGSTRETAEAVATALRDSGLEASVLPASDVRSLDEFGTVVLGAPLYIGRLHKDADRFLLGHREALAERSVAVFTLGPISSPPDEREWQGAREQLDKELAKYPWLDPLAREVFGGKYDPKALRFPDNLLTWLPASPLKNVPASDVRDMQAIRAWASELADQIRASA